MAVSLKQVAVAPKGMGLYDFVAQQEGFFAAEGLDVEFDWKTFRGTQSSWKHLDYFQRPQDRPYTQDKREVIQGACLWGTICNASAGMGKMVPDAYGVSPWAIFVRPDSKIRRPEDLKDVPVSVGMRAGSHFNVPYRLEKYLPLENIKVVNTGGFGARLKALLDGEVEAASLLPPQIAMAEQLGLRKIIDDTFKTLWWVPDGFEPEAVRGYLRALERAEQALDADWRSICRCGSSRSRQSSRASTPGTSRSSAAASASTTRRYRARSSTTRSRRSSPSGCSMPARKQNAGYEHRTGTHDVIRRAADDQGRMAPLGRDRTSPTEQRHGNRLAAA